MKKNLITVVILALVLVNLVLTAVLAITIVPETQKANKLITQISSAIDLELSDEPGASEENIPIEQIDVYDIADTMTINLKKGEDGQEHYAVLTVSLSLNKEADKFDDYKKELEAKPSLIKTEVNNVVATYTYEEIKADPQAVQDAILADLQKLFPEDFIVAVGFSSSTYQ